MLNTFRNAHGEGATEGNESIRVRKGKEGLAVGENVFVKRVMTVALLPRI